jgi:hypothetical protein
VPAAAKRTPEEEERIEREFLAAADPAPEMPPDEDDAPAQEVTFRAKGVNFRAVMKPRQRWTAPNGEVQVTDGRTLEFAPTGEFRTSDPAEIRHLRGLPTFNREFWEVGAEPHAAPSARPVFDKIADAAVALDADALAELEVRERETHNRVFVLDAIRSARERVQGALAAAAEGAS